jgi:hypothetical protein
MANHEAILEAYDNTTRGIGGGSPFRAGVAVEELLAQGIGLDCAGWAAFGSLPFIVEAQDKFCHDNSAVFSSSNANVAQL